MPTPLGRRLDRLEEAVADPFDALSDEELLAELEREVQAMQRGEGSAVPDDTVSPGASGPWANVSDADLLRQLEEARAEVDARRPRPAPPPPPEPQFLPVPPAVIEPHPVAIPDATAGTSDDPAPTPTTQERCRLERAAREREAAAGMRAMVDREREQLDRERARDRAQARRWEKEHPLWGAAVVFDGNATDAMRRALS